MQNTGTDVHPNVYSVQNIIIYVKMAKFKIVGKAKPQVQLAKAEVKKMEKPKEEVKPAAKPLTPQEMWDAALAERKTKPPWSCSCNEVPIYDYYPVVLLNEEMKSMDDNVFKLGEPLSVSVALLAKKVAGRPTVMIPGVGVTLLPPGAAPYEKVTDAEGKVRFRPEFLGEWQFIVSDVGIAPKFKVTQ